MNGTDPVVPVRRRTARAFLKYLLVTACAAGLASLVCRIASIPAARYAVTVPDHAGLLPTVTFLLESQISAAALLLLTALAAQSVLCQPVLLTGCVMRGASMGFAAVLLHREQFSLPRAGLAVSLYFCATVCWLALAAVTEPASEAVCRAYASGNVLRYRALTRDYLHRFLALSGMIFKLGSIAALLL